MNSRWVTIAGIAVATLAFLDQQLVSQHLGGTLAMTAGVVLAALGKSLFSGSGGAS